jgi:hypothetical protein
VDAGTDVLAMECLLDLITTGAQPFHVQHQRVKVTRVPRSLLLRRGQKHRQVGKGLIIALPDLPAAKEIALHSLQLMKPESGL